MSAHYHPYRSVTGTSPVSGQFLSPDYYPTQVYGPGATRRRSNSGDHRSPSPTQIKRLSDSHLRPMDYSQALPVYSRPVSPIYGGGYPSPQDLRHGSLSPAFGSYPEPNSYMVPSDNSTFVDNFAVYNTGLSCTQCPYQASTCEGLQRHLQKHAKSHHCRFPNCSRTEGFATPNDRERHEKSVHKIPGQYWKCMDQQCSSYGKEFSRRDNLKDHLRRMHPVPEGMSETEANMMRSRQADDWRFEKRPGAENTPERLGSYEPLRGAGTYDVPPSSGAYYGAY
ncbi:hypothetical protein EX30DRAFT_341892 [Ascodesmis nigricans]|uniref:C2H2-type domain-containing protein n=1 Tax=Ascodesmis nigricans TaxID=341454 RepID=A0A4V3SIG4_9PEZI|nr:hypothetical protein EX30DRAFT_341892 [Ascodesmis nigricans]